MFPYTVPGIGNLIHTMLPIEDRLRMDCVSKEIRKFHRQEVYPHAKGLNVELVMDEADTYQSGISYAAKMSEYAELIQCVPNKHDLKLPALRKMPKVKSIVYAVTIVMDVGAFFNITNRTSDQWTSVEELLHDFAENDHPLQSVYIVPGNIEFVRLSPETAEETEKHVLEDRAEATHSAYYRRFGYDTLYIPMCLYRKDFQLYLPKYLTATVSQEQHGRKITYWDDGPAGSIGRLILDFY